jgi:hypothetical protein
MKRETCELETAVAQLLHLHHHGLVAADVQSPRSESGPLQTKPVDPGNLHVVAVGIDDLAAARVEVVQTAAGLAGLAALGAAGAADAQLGKSLGDAVVDGAGGGGLRQGGPARVAQGEREGHVGCRGGVADHPHPYGLARLAGREGERPTGRGVGNAGLRRTVRCGIGNGNRLCGGRRQRDNEASRCIGPVFRDRRVADRQGGQRRWSGLTRAEKDAIHGVVRGCSRGVAHAEEADGNAGARDDGAVVAGVLDKIVAAAGGGDQAVPHARDLRAEIKAKRPVGDRSRGVVGEDDLCLVTGIPTIDDLKSGHRRGESVFKSFQFEPTGLVMTAGGARGEGQAAKPGALVCAHPVSWSFSRTFLPGCNRKRSRMS